MGLRGQSRIDIQGGERHERLTPSHWGLHHLDYIAVTNRIIGFTAQSKLGASLAKKLTDDTPASSEDTSNNTVGGQEPLAPQGEL